MKNIINNTLGIAILASSLATFHPSITQARDFSKGIVDGIIGGREIILSGSGKITPNTAEEPSLGKLAKKDKSPIIQNNKIVKPYYTFPKSNNSSNGGGIQRNNTLPPGVAMNGNTFRNSGTITGPNAGQLVINGKVIK